MKRFFALFLTVTILLSFTACHKDMPEPANILGEVDGQTYENTFMGMGFRLSKQWKLYPSDEIENPMTTGDQQCAVYAQRSSGQLALWIYFEKMDKDKLLELNESEYGAKVLFRGPRIHSSGRVGNESSYSHLSVNIGERTIAGSFANRSTPKDYWSTEKRIHYCEAVFAIKCEGYLVQIRLLANKRDEILDIMDCFYLLEE